MKNFILEFKENIQLPLPKISAKNLKDRRILVKKNHPVWLITRLSKIVLVASVALFLTLTIFNHVIHYPVHLTFLQNVMSMNSVFLDNQMSWRAITIPLLQQLIYWIFVLWEVIAAALCWRGVYEGWQASQENPTTFQQAKALAIGGLTLTLLMWMVAFVVGGEWFLMWQSEIWNGQETAFRLITMIGIILIFISLPEQNPAECP